MRIVRLAASIIALTASGAANAQTATARQPAYPTPYPQAAPYPTPYAALPVSDADNLATEIRLLAADPNNVQALVRAGELALKLEDQAAAAAFFARASRIDPRNARVKAGEGSLLVTAERPGEALRHFAEAQALGGDVQTFAADRALAYDLIGEQERAQRDYRLALRATDDAETRRRYALSLAISGKRDQALKEIEPLLRKSDRGAWRARAFILAMGGDRAGAERIATTMMPAGMAQGLQPFFEALPSLRPADRAFAVHFGEVRASPMRIADARMTPPLAALGPDTTAPVEVAATVRTVVVATPTSKPNRKDRRSRKDQQRETIVAATTPPVVPLPAPPAYVAQASVPVTTLYQGPRYTGQSRAPSSGTRAANLAAANALRSPSATVAFANTPSVVQPSTVSQSVPSQPAATNRSVASTQSYTAAPRGPAVPSSVALGSSTLVLPTRGAPTASLTPAAPASSAVALAGATLSPTQRANMAMPSVATPSSTVAPRSVANAIPQIPQTSVPAGATMPSPVVVASAVPAAAPVVGTFGAPESTAPTSIASVPSQASAVVATPTPVRSEDSILAAIIAGINVPGTELGVAAERMAVTSPPPIRRALPSRPLAQDIPAVALTVPLHSAGTHAGKTVVDKTMPDHKATDRKSATKIVAETDTSDENPTGSRKTLNTRKTAAEKSAGDDGDTPDKIDTAGKTRAVKNDKAGWDDKAGKSDKATKKAADAKKLADAKKAEEKRKNDPKLLEPQRYWVQVAGGANENDLPKQWAKLKTKNAKVLGGRAGYATPLRATNRILTGPFKTDDEAQAFVNTLAKQGMSGFVFASEAGQKVTKLPGK